MKVPVEPVVAAGGAVAARAALGARQLGDLDEPHVLDALHDELRDPVAAAQAQLGARGSWLMRQTRISPRKPASIVPGVLTTDRPARAASPERGCTNPA